MCSDGARNCDANVVNGCEQRNTNPTCATATALGMVGGDVGADVLTRSGYGEAFFQVRVTENNGSSTDIDAQFTLVSPPGVDFDLYVTCLACGGAWRWTLAAG